MSAETSAVTGWRRTRLWFALGVAVLLGALLVTSVTDSPSRPLDPASAHKNGSKALVTLLAQYGSAVHAVNSVVDATGAAGNATVVVTSPGDYSLAQLHRLSSSADRLVLVLPDERVLSEFAPGIEPAAQRAPDSEPGCGDAGALAAGEIASPADALVYTGGAQSCYGGMLVTAPKLAVLGSADILRNDHLARRGIAALTVNTITAQRSGEAVVWLLPGGDAAGPGPASLWQLFPAGAHRAFWWLLALGVLVVLWRARRLGGVVTEPLPVVVRSAEVVEGHGRLYLRAGARDRAGSALRIAATGRLAARLGLPRDASAEQVAVAAAPIIGRTPAETVRLLNGAPARDDAGLMRLADELDVLESAVRAAASEGATLGE